MNVTELKEKLLKKGYAFNSQTDTEVAVKLVDYYYKKDAAADPVKALSRAMVRIRGSYALALMFKDYPEEIFAARKDSPMIIGVEKGETYIKSNFKFTILEIIPPTKSSTEIIHKECLWKEKLMTRAFGFNKN